ncbi:MAG: hypothetical protein CL840_14490 [Crocinitomicaceae bacterium]|nr:hypothetical protein [Crocinitomicaceae bacterium]|tara:strand:+ start:3082 stop:4167 length:1086 start_codon:yes stop_codon:yes gene_type:complete
MEPLKNMFHRKVIEALAHAIKTNDKAFKSNQFVNAVIDNQWEKRELKDRIFHTAVSLAEFLPNDYEKATVIIQKASKILPAGFEQMPLPTYVEHYGVNHFNTSMKTLEIITQGSTGEFAIRPFLKKDSVKTLKKMENWARHKNEHVRRLASEGCRPRLPWGGNFDEAIRNPGIIVPILETLKNDDSLYVRKSVGNSLNDISKDNPDVALETSIRWLKEDHEHARWIVKKGLRGLLKQAHPKSLELFGYTNPKSISIHDFELKENTVKIGSRLNFEFSLSNESKTDSKIRAEYLIDYCKKSGRSTKVFQIAEFELPAKKKRKFKKYQSFADMSTRKHIPGTHFIAIRVNGVIKQSLIFEVIK